MYQIDDQSRMAVYEQIVEQVERYVLTGVLTGGDKMPSVRKLSMELHVNPNTVQRAYTELERTGVIQTAPGKGTFVCKDASETVRGQRRARLTDLRRLVRELALGDVGKDEIIALTEEIYEEGFF